MDLEELSFFDKKFLKFDEHYRNYVYSHYLNQISLLEDFDFGQLLSYMFCSHQSMQSLSE